MSGFTFRMDNYPPGVSGNEPELTGAVEPMRFAYADPPYIGIAHRYKEKTEVDHAELVKRLVREYPDGWALSLSVPSLKYILNLCPDDVRVLAWVKPWCAWKQVHPAYAWEPVIMHGGRRRKKGERCRDWFAGAATTRLYFNLGEPAIGAKSEKFCRWVLDCLGWENGDEIDDLYPGTGVMSRVAKQLCLATGAGKINVQTNTKLSLGEPHPTSRIEMP